MAAGGVDVSRRSVVVDHAKKGYESYRNGSRDLYPSQGGRLGERRQIRRSFAHDRKRKDLRLELAEEPGLVSERGEARAEGVQQPPEKRGKYSPVIWDAEDKVIAVQPRKTVKLASASLSADSLAILQPIEAQLSVQDPIDDLEEGQLEEEVQAPNISKSRWAWGLDSPKVVSVSEVENVPKTSKWNRSSLTPECEEFVLEESEEQRSRSSGCGGGRLSTERLSGHECSDYELESHSHMDIDEAQCYSSDLNKLENEEPASPAEGSTDMLLGSRNVDEYEKLNKINEGTYGVVYRARDKKTGDIVALKKIKMNMGREVEYGFPVTSLREINILLSCNHPSIVNVKEVVVGNNDNVFMVMEHLEHDLRGLMDRMKQPFSTSEVKCLMVQLLEGVKYLHSNWIIHRDLKPSNLLMNNSGEMKICDFGMARQYGSPLKPYTQLVVTQWYRAPELLLGAKKYSTAVDMWSVGCIMAELLSRNPLFQGKGGSDIDQLRKIFAILGSPSETTWPGFSSLPGAKANFINQPYNLLRKKFPAASFTGSPVLSDLGFDLLNRLLSCDPEKEVPLPKSKEFMPTFPPKRG
ncbi:PREDICTED: cyclin-dependent kinase G1 isoform X2 [Tarenaya hassleriana]|uniref:cyclin-dependent kinase G1 isoform X2 n=1 Tax=Tarenaya hassleriana TaxID=28532 RepID=UPI00053C8624|nr:PREDICTED: cyclin-dependent kinase G1 isoform X2 [Tarenaya hassleriana]